MKVWLALLAAPLAALASNHLGYALAAGACVRGSEWWLHTSFALFLLFTLGATGLAWSELRRRERHETLVLVATWTGAFSALVVATMWAMRLFLDPCMH
jgi:hypothetical protein